MKNIWKNNNFKYKIMNAYDLSESLPKIQAIFKKHTQALEKRLGNETWSPEGFIEADPTPNKIYLDWIINSYILGGIRLYEDVISRVRPALEDFEYLKEAGYLTTGDKPWENERDINNYCGLRGCKKKKFEQRGLEELLEKYKEALESRQEKLKENEQIRKDTEIVFSNHEVTVYYPKIEESSCYYGQGTRWCTAATRAENMFDEYNNKGPLYIIIGRDGKKYQMHVETLSLMDAEDEEFDIEELLTLYPSLKKFKPAIEFKNTKDFLNASEVGNTNIVKELLSIIDPSIRNNFAIRFAAKNGHKDVVELLLKDSRVDPGARDNEAIRYAAYYGHKKTVELLLEDSRVDPSAVNSQAIIFAAKNGHKDVVELLLRDPRVDPSAKDNWVIRLAAKNGHKDVVELLLKDDRVKNSLSKKELQNIRNG